VRLEKERLKTLIAKNMREPLTKAHNKQAAKAA
jgi:hypothetical protein